MSQEPRVEYLKPFIEATVDSAARFRRVLIVLIIASVLAFGAFWNARKGSWLHSRIELVHTAEAVLQSSEVAKDLSQREQSSIENINALAGTISEPERSTRLIEQKKLNEDLQRLSQKQRELQANLQKRDVAAATQWIAMSGITTSEQLKPVHQLLDSAYVNYILLVHVPFFGSVFDVNELGLLGGFTFVVILMWFRFSLWREYYNLSSTFEAARTVEDLETCYKYLAMSQVLTVPPILLTLQPRERPWGKVVRSLYLLPIAVLMAIVAYDCYSFELGWMVSKFNTVVSISASICFLVLVGLLTFWCFRLSSEIDNEWVKRSLEIEENKKSGTVITPTPTYFRQAGRSR